MSETASPPTMDDVKQAISDAIDAFNSNRYDILQAAFKEGGRTEVDSLNQEYDTLRDAYFELVNRELDENNGQYADLTQQASAATLRLTQVVAAFATASQVVNAMASVIDIVGRVIMILGL